MDPYSQPKDLGVNDLGRSISDMKPDQSTQPPNFTWTTPVEAASTTANASPATVEPHERNKDLQEMLPDEQAPAGEGLLLTPDDKIQALYDAYQASYASPMIQTTTQMRHATDLATALLQRHYPESQGYLVEQAALGPLSAKGLNFILKESNEPDSDPDVPPPKKAKRTVKTPNAYYSYEAPWHYIPPDHLAALVVKQRIPGAALAVANPTARTHTCLVIILDDLSTLYRWSRANVNHRGDVLSDLLGVLGGVETGHGILLFGPRLELYTYDAANDVAPVAPLAGRESRVDMRTAGLAEVDGVLSGFAARGVVHRAGL
ncbi:hypothetical protein EJ07DRAFT_172838 [Lizonia empirigonia]|nr:hypothetical protein EJ07DRAFT_172838 [Lizonia empirigonia]